MAKVATDFEKIINEGRERKKNEALADRIFSKNRRQSAPSKLKAPTGPSLASRVGVKKQRNSSIGLRSTNPSPGNVNGEWTHDLHHAVDGDSRSLSSRITGPGAARRANKRASRLSAAVDRMDTSDDAPQQVNIVKPASGMGLTIRGLAGPFTVMAQNFAPGTTAADVESAMTPIGGEMLDCKIVKVKPFMIVEMEFVSREGGERVIETFNNKTADGRLIKVYPKIGGSKPPSASDRSNNDPPSNAPNGPRASRPAKAPHRENVVDGSMGFPDLIANGTGGSSAKNDRLYSDRLVGGGGGNRRGRGFPRGRGGR